MQTNVIHTGDSAEVLKSFPDGCIDLSVQSPPYDNLRDYKGFTFNFEVIANELFRITKDGGVCVWVVGDATVDGSESGTSFKQALYFMECGFNLHDTMIWFRRTIPQTSSRYDNAFEYMFVFSKGSVKTFNPIKVKRQYEDRRKMKEGQRKSNGERSFRKNSQSPDVLEINVWDIPTGGGISASDKYAYEHPAIFPEELARDHILSWSNEGDIVLDCFAGSGTTLKMAKMLSRQYIGIEISPEYVTLAEKRLLATNVPLFGQGGGLTLPAPDGGDSAPSQALSTPDMFSAIEHEPTPAPRR